MKYLQKFLFLFLFSLFILPLFAEQSSEQKAMDEALLQIKNDLIGELKEGHPDLAKNLSALNPDQIGAFVGSMSAGDYNAAFNIAGTEASTYFVNRFTEHYGEMIDDNSPAADMIKYSPLNVEDTKAILKEVLNGDFYAASAETKKRLSKTGKESLEALSKDIVIHGIDWVLSNVTNRSPGALFVQVVEYEIAFLDYADDALKRYFSNHIYDYYNTLREEGKTPKEAYRETFEVKYPLAEIKVFGVKEIKDVRAFSERQYQMAFNISTQSDRQKLAQQRQSSMELIRQIMHEQRQIMFEEFMRIAAKYAKDNEQIKALVSIFKQTADRNALLRKEAARYSQGTKQLLRWYDELGISLVTLKIEAKNYAALEEKATALAQSCAKLKTQRESVEKQLDTTQAYLEKIYKRGKECVTKRNESCENPDNTAIAKKAIKFVNDSIAMASHYEVEIGNQHNQVQKALTQLRKMEQSLRALKNEMQRSQTRIKEALRLTKHIKTLQPKLDSTYTGSIEQLYNEIKALLHTDIMQKYAKKSADNLIKVAGELKRPALDAYIEVEKAKSSKSEKIQTIQSSADTLLAQHEAMEKQLEACKNSDILSVEMIEKQITKDKKQLERYKNSFQNILEKIRTCTDMQDPLGQKDWIRQLFTELKATKKTMHSHHSQLNAYSGKLKNILSNLQNITPTLNASLSEVASLSKACEAQKQKSGANPDAIARATARSASQSTQLKEHFAAAADASSEACSYILSMNNQSTYEECNAMAPRANAAAALSQREANKAQNIATQLQNRYAELLQNDANAALDQLVRDAISKRLEINEIIEKGERQLRLSGHERSGEILAEAQSHYNRILQYRKIATNRIATLRFTLPMEYHGDTAKQALKQIDAIEADIANIANQAKQTQIKNIEIATAIQTEAQKIDALLSKLRSVNIELAKCRNESGANEMNDLRTYSDTAELFGPYAQNKASDAVLCATKLEALCEEIKNRVQTCTTDHNCDNPNHTCNLDGICVPSSGGGFDPNAWDEREQQRQDEIGTRFDQDNADEWSESNNRYGQDDMMQDTNATIEGLRGRSSSSKKSSSTWQSSSSKSSTTRSSSSSQSSKKSSSSSKSSVKSSSSSSTQAAASQGSYYLITEVSTYFTRTANCKSIDYNILGPLDQSAAQAFVKQRKSENKQRVGVKRYPFYKKITLKLGKASATKPTLPESSNTCNNCPSGQHIGLDSNKRYCHGN